MKNKGKAKTYCYKIAALCFSLTFGEDAVQAGEILLPKWSSPDTIPASVLIHNYYVTNIALLECIVKTDVKNYDFLITTFNENMNPIFVMSSEDINITGIKVIRAKVSGIST